MFKFTVFFAILIASIAKISAGTAEISSAPISKISNEIISKTNVNYQEESCKNFEKYACGKTKRLSLFDNRDIKLDTEDEKIINDFNETCSQTVNKEYHARLFEIAQEFDFIQSFSKKNEGKNEKFTTEELSEVVAYLSVTNELFAINKKPDQKASFFSAQFDSLNNLYLSIYKQGGEWEFINNVEKEGAKIASTLNEFIKNANEVITNEKYDFLSLHGKDFVKIDTVEELKKLIPTKHFDWETYVEQLMKLYDVKHIRHIKFTKSDLEQLKDFFEVVDNTDVEVLMQYAANRFIFVLTTDLNIIMCEKIGIELTNLHHFRSSLSNNYLNDPEIVEAELDYLDKFENHFAKEIKVVPKFENYISFKRSMLKGDDNLLKNYEKDQFYKNLIALWINMKKTTGTFDWTTYSFPILTYENKPKELFALLETYEIIKLYFGNIDLWTDENIDIAEKCLKGSSNNTAAFVKSYIAMQYALEFFNENYRLPGGYPFEYHQLFSLLLTQGYCSAERTLEPIMEAFKHSEWFSAKFKCREGDELYYQTLKECNMKNPYNTFVGKYMPIKFTN